MAEIFLNFGQGSDETDVGLGFIFSYLYYDTDTKEIFWDILPQDKKYGHPKSDSPGDVLDFINENYDNFYEKDSTIDLICDFLKNENIEGNY